MSDEPPITSRQPAYSEMALSDLVDAFSSTDPVPGGGSAAALAGAVGASLLLMVAGMSKTKTGAPEETADLAEAAARLRPLRDSLLELVDRDSEAYGQVMTAFKLPRGSDVEKSRRQEAIETATRWATEVPLETMRACQQALRGALTVATNGNRRAVSDVGVAIDLLYAALRGGRMNVEINLAALNDTEYVARIRTEVGELGDDAGADAARGKELLGLV
jgi:glutamate formiminotransferase/formiminotetrahydrofolate cyclodeaminase